jgi:hypothetical protein
MTVSSRTFSDGTVLAHSERGTARMSRLKPGVLLYVCSGYFPHDFYEPMVVVAQSEVDRHGSLAMLVDGWHLSGIDTAYREAWTAWFRLHKAHFRMTLLVRTRLMEMAASLANLFTGINVITTYSNVAEWERACAADVPGFRKQSMPAV